nr:MAG TPA: hypothetical protein [Caudoviricetes sp.]
MERDNHPLNYLLAACRFRHCVFILLIHQVRSEIMGFFDRTFHRILLCLNHYIF